MDQSGLPSLHGLGAPAQSTSKECERHALQHHFFDMSDGVIERLFTVGEIPGVLWTPEDATGSGP